MKIIVKNSTLVFQRLHQKTIVYKDYWVRGDGQYITLTGVNDVQTLAFDNIKIEAEIYAGLTTYTTQQHIITARSSNACLQLRNPSKLTWTNNSYTGASYELTPVSVGTYTIVANNKTGVVTINGTDYNFTAPSSSAINHMWMFAVGSNQEGMVADSYQEGGSKVGRIKVYNATTNALVLDLRPAIVDDVPCIYEEVTGTELHSGDGTALVLEDAE